MTRRFIERFTPKPIPQDDEYQIYPIPVELQPFFAFFEKKPENMYPVSNHFPFGEQHRSLFRSYNHLLTDTNKSTLDALSIRQSWSGMITNEESAVKFFSFLMLLGEPAVASWITPDLPAIQKEETTLGVDLMTNVLKQAARLSQVCKLSDICRFERIIRTQRKQNQYYRGTLKLDEWLERFLADPSPYLPMIRVLRQYEAPDKIPWSVRIQTLEEVKAFFGASSLVTNDEVRETLFKLWQPTQQAVTSLRTDSEQPASPIGDERSSTTLGAPRIEKRALKLSELESLKSQLQNGLPPAHLPLLRQVIQNSLPQEEIKARMAFRERQAQVMNLFAHPLHPFRMYGVNIGFEIEADTPRTLPAMHDIWKDLELIGFHMGLGGRDSETRKADMEVSPGPFSSAIEAKAAFEVWRQGDVLDLSAQHMQTCHMNVELSNRGNLHSLNEFAMFSAYAYHPQSAPKMQYCRLTSPEAKKSLINSHSYFETKGFFVVNPHDFVQHLEEYFLLATAARASESLSFNPYTRKLTQIWQKAVEEKNQIKMQLGVETDRMMPTNDQIAEILHVFPTPEDHYDFATRAQKNSVNNLGLNLVKSTRTLTAWTCQQIEAVMMTTQNEFMHTLQLYSRATEAKRDSIAAHFYKLYPEYQQFGSLDRVLHSLMPVAKPFLEPENTLPRPI